MWSGVIGIVSPELDAVTKTVVAGGRYGLGSPDYSAWRAAELEAGRTYAHDLGSEAWTAWRNAELAAGRSYAHDLSTGGYVTVANDNAAPVGGMEAA